MKCFKCGCDAGDGRFCPECGSELFDARKLQEECAKDADACRDAVRSGQGSRTYIRQNFDKRLSDWKGAAELGIAQAQWLLGRCYDEGFGVEKNQVRAVGWHLKAAEQGFAPAQNHIGSCYLDGEAVAEDQAEAVRWFSKAAEQGYTIAQSNLGWCYDTASGVEVDEAEAARWFRRAADAGDETAQFNLAVHFEYGSGVEQDSTEALKWYRKAAERGYERAQEALEKLEKTIAEEKQQKAKQAQEAEKEFRSACEYALARGQQRPDETDELTDLAKSLELSEGFVKRIFEEEKNSFLEKQRREQQAGEAEVKFRIACKKALADGQVTLEEKDELKKLVKSLKLAGEAAKKIFKEEKTLFEETRVVTLEPQVESKFRRVCRDALADGKITVDEKKQLTEMARFFKIPSKQARELFDDEKKIFLTARKTLPLTDAEQKLRVLCREILADGKVTRDEMQSLAELAKSLHIPKQAVKQIFEQEKRIFLKKHLGKHTR